VNFARKGGGGRDKHVTMSERMITTIYVTKILIINLYHIIIPMTTTNNVHTKKLNHFKCLSRFPFFCYIFFIVSEAKPLILNTLHSTETIKMRLAAITFEAKLKFDNDTNELLGETNNFPVGEILSFPSIGKFSERIEKRENL
jgi:hypothetical protein